MNNYEYNEKKDEYDDYIKEDFCGACVAAPLASASVGVISSKDANDPDQYDNIKF